MITVIEATGIALAAAILTYVARFLWIALNAPFNIIKEQDNIIESNKKKIDKEKILVSLRIQRRVGTEIRNKGSGLVHINSVDNWEKELEDWKEVTANIIAAIDEEQSVKWRTLTNYVPKMFLPNPLSDKQNNLYAQYSERLDRLDKVTEFIREKD